ncbi:MAG: urease accessory protein UreE, partial [Pseudomonadota bacterium]
DVSKDHDGPASANVLLDSGERHLRRKVLTLDTGERVLVDLPESRQLSDGDRLVLEDGRSIEIKAKSEPLIEIRADTARALTVLAWHIGNRHLPAEIHADCIRIQQDHVIVDMLKGLNADITDVTAPFQPERGAYHRHAHSHSHEHSQSQGHAHSHGHTHSHGPSDGHGNGSGRHD